MRGDPLPECLCVLCAYSVSAKFRIDAELHQKAFAVLGQVQHRQAEAHLLPVLLKEQVITAVGLTVVDLLDLRAVLRIIQKVGQVFIFGIGEDIARVIGMHLLPEAGYLGFRDRFTDGDRIGHLHSSKNHFRRVRMRAPSIHDSLSSSIILSVRNVCMRQPVG